MHAGGRAARVPARGRTTPRPGFGGIVNITHPADDGRPADRVRRDDAAGVLPVRRRRGVDAVRRAGAAGRACPNPKVGVYANDSNATVTTRDDAVFDYFRHRRRGCRTTTAPTTTHDARAGRAGRRTAVVPLAVQVTLSTEAGATTEYQIGDAPSRTTRAGHADDDGTTTVDVPLARRRRQPEADKTVTVKVDTARPRPSTGGAGRRHLRRAGDGDAGGADPAGGSGSTVGVPARRRRVDGVHAAGHGLRRRRARVEHRATDVAGNVGAVGRRRSRSKATRRPARRRSRVRRPVLRPGAAAGAALGDRARPDGGALAYAWEFETARRSARVDADVHRRRARTRRR